MSAVLDRAELSIPEVDDTFLAQFDQPFSDLSVAAIMADEQACGRYRIQAPIDALARGGAQATVLTKLSSESIEPYEIILAQRQYSPNINRMLQDLKRRGRIIVYEVDDNLHAVNPNSAAYSVYRPGSQVLKNVEQCIRTAHGLFVTTPELASAYRGYAQRTWVLPNQLDIGGRNWDTPQERDPRLQGKTVIGWAGSITHQDDYQVLGAALGRVLRRHPEAVFCMVSAQRVVKRFVDHLKLPEEQVVVLDPVPFDDYPPLLSQYDIGLVPVVNDHFNSSKSDLKCLEYGAWGVPYVASKIAPYVRLHQESQGIGGFLAASPQEWEAGLEHFLIDEADRKARGAALREYVRGERAMSANVWRWAEALREVRALVRTGDTRSRQYHIPHNIGRNDRCPCGCGKKYKQHKEVFGSWGK